MSNLIAIGSSDWHLHNWNQFNKDGLRIEIARQFLVNLFVEAEEKGVPILFPGDLWHTPQGIATKTFYIFSKLFNELRKQFPTVKVIGIPGNHDQSENSKIGSLAPNLFSAWCECFPEIFKDVSFKILETDNMIISGIPYINHNIGFTEFVKGRLRDGIRNISKKNPEKIKVLLIHTDLMGALDTSGREVGQVENIPRSLGKFFKDWDIVLSGHIHKPQVMWEGSVIMVGSPYQQRRSDSGCDMGYWHIYSDKSYEFIKYDSPGFRFYSEGKEHENTDDFWIPIPKEVKIEKKKTKKFNPKMNRTKMAKKYVRAKGIKDETKLQALIDTLNKVEE